MLIASEPGLRWQSANQQLLSPTISSEAFMPEPPIQCIRAAHSSGPLRNDAVKFDGLQISHKTWELGSKPLSTAFPSIARGAIDSHHWSGWVGGHDVQHTHDTFASSL
jgi:hypothetical protein